MENDDQIKTQSLERSFQQENGLEQNNGVEIRVRGLVQGVGFRPTVWQLANRHRLVGQVQNDGEGVFIQCWGADQSIKQFLSDLRDEKPPLSRIDEIECTPCLDDHSFHEFTIGASGVGVITTSIVPDAATCQHCLEDVFDEGNRRYRYPFTNCTHCGPRLSITHTIPYDRENTSMASFTMCDECLAEYENPGDRRFHAQPNACDNCGPSLWLCTKDGERLSLPEDVDALSFAQRLISQGYILAIKGIGGFHLACDATNSVAVANLRQRKKRYGKPLALMARSIDMIKDYAIVSEADELSLKDVCAPIVLLPKKQDGLPLSEALAPGQTTLGFMLPYTGMHHLLLDEADVPLVMTSGNLSSEPQVIDNDAALQKLGTIADYWMMHDREIINRLDDSIVQSVGGQSSILRRARGFAPAPLALPEGFENACAILAMGAQLKNTFCLLKNGQAIVSQHIGDLEERSAHEDYRKALDLYYAAYDFTPQLIGVDLHPDYFSTKWGQGLCSERQIPFVGVQHHHAHIAACMAEHQMPLNRKGVLGIALDGLGYGDNDELWGGEFLIADYKTYKRVAHFEPVALPGGGIASYEPWRNTFAHLEAAIGWSLVDKNYGALELVHYLKTKPLAQMATMIERNLNAPKVSSAGRLFDGVAGALGVCRDGVDFEGQAAMALQALAQGYPQEDHAYDVCTSAVLSWKPLWEGILNDLKNNVSVGRIARRFHNTLICVLSKTAISIAQKNNLDVVVLSGGVFQNSLLSEGVYEDLSAHGIRVLMPQKYPANDGGVSLGQAVICAARSL